GWHHKPVALLVLGSQISTELRRLRRAQSITVGDREVERGFGLGNLDRVPLVRIGKHKGGLHSRAAIEAAPGRGADEQRSEKGEGRPQTRRQFRRYHDASLHPLLLNDIADVAVKLADRRPLGVAPINSIHLAEQVALHLPGPTKSLIGLCNILSCGGLHHIGGDEHDELSFVLQKITAAKQSTENRKIFETWVSAQRLLGRIGKQACHDQRAAAWKLDRGFGAPHLQGWDGDVREDDSALI